MRNYYGSLCTKLYHASPTAGLTVLRPSVTEFFGKPRQVCLTSLKPMALLYGIKHFEYAYGYAKDGGLYYEEYHDGRSTSPARWRNCTGGGARPSTAAPGGRGWRRRRSPTSTSRRNRCP